MRFCGLPCRLLFSLAAWSLLGGSRLAALDLHPQRLAPTDLAVSGLFRGVDPVDPRYVSWADLAQLPNSQLELEGEFLPGRQTVTVVYLADLWRALAPDETADGMLATCSDGYLAVYSRDVITRCRPFLILEINGLGPEHWPPEGLKFNPGPYVISVSPQVAPAVAQLVDPGHKKPWGVTGIRLVRLEESFAGIFRGPWLALSGRAVAGRELWINSCASCHSGPAGTTGGTKSDRPFEVLAAHARYNREYFKSYVRHPQALVATAKMEPHPHYTDAQLDALMAFLTAEPPP